MNKRAMGKIEKRAKQKVINGERLTPSERVVFRRSMEIWLGPSLVKQIKQFGGK